MPRFSGLNAMPFRVRPNRPTEMVSAPRFPHRRIAANGKESALYRLCVRAKAPDAHDFRAPQGGPPPFLHNDIISGHLPLSICKDIILNVLRYLPLLEMTFFKRRKLGFVTAAKLILWVDVRGEE